MRLLGDLWRRQPLLAGFGFLMVALLVPELALQALDPRVLNGESVWAKPARFAVAIGVFSLTAAWLFGYVRPERRGSPPALACIAMLLAGGAFEISYITWQAALGQASHFNRDTAFHAAMYGTMGVMAVTMVGSGLPLAWEIWRRPAPGTGAGMRLAITAGLLITFAAGGGIGGLISAHGGPAVGPEGVALPVLGWNLAGGDLRVGHFLGLHAQQALPALAWALRGPAPGFWPMAVASILWIAGTLAAVSQALAGQPLLSGIT